MSTVPSNTQAQHTMQCMEVWGGNRAIDNGVIMPGLDAWVFCRPHQDQAAGGDVHYVSSCATGRITRLLVADVSGHGDSVAEVGSSLRALMRRYVNFIDQTRLVRGLNTEFAALSSAGCFATAVVATYFAPTSDLTLSNAGHPRPLWFKGSTRTWSVLDHTSVATPGLANIPLGIAEPTEYDQLDIRLGRGDLLLLYTDSLIEAKNATGRMLGEAGLLEIVRGLDTGQPTAFIQTLLDAICAHTGKGDLTTIGDDVTVLLLRPNDMRPRRTFRDWFLITRRFISLFAGRLVGRGPAPWPEFTLANIGGAFTDRLSRLWRPGKGRAQP